MSRLKDRVKSKVPKLQQLRTFSERNEEQLKQDLFEVDNNEDNEESPTYEPIEDWHIKRTNALWDVILEDEIKYFDPELSYELTGYRPISETEGLDFDPAPFREVGQIYERTGQYTAYPKGSKPFVDFWHEQIKRCVEGYTVGKYRVTGDHYFFLNFYRMGIVDDKKKAGAGSEESFPFFTVEQYKYFHYIEICEHLKKDVCALKARAVGFSEIGACLGVRPFITTRKFRTLYTAALENYLDDVLDKCWYQLNWLNNNTGGGMKRVRQKIDNLKHKRATKVDKEGNESGRFAEIEGIVADNPRKLRGSRNDRLLFEECFAPETEIIMSDYSIKRIKDVALGDTVLGVDGLPKKVINVSRGVDDMYNIIQNKGVDYKVNSKHQLCVVDKHAGAKNVLMTPMQYLALSKTKKRYIYGECSHGVLGYKDCELDPYYFGAWLGDGYSNYPNRIIINEHADPEIIDYVCKYYDSIPGGETCTYKEDLNDKTTVYYKSGFPKGKNPIINQYKKFNLIKNKHIPKEVFESSLEYRLKVLAGLIDTDGFIKSKNVIGGMSFSIEMSRKELIRDITMLARSCGFRCSCSERTRDRGYINGYYVHSQTEYIVHIKGDVHKIPTLVQRKQISVRRVSDSFITKLDVVPAGKGEYIGITLEYTGKKTDNLFFLKDFTVVHNCGSNPTMRTSWTQGTALVEVGGVRRGIKIAFGTGGDSGQGLAGLAEIFSNPEAHGVLPYKNNYTADGKIQYTGFFIPAYSFMLGSDFTDHRGVTDRVKAKAWYEEQRKKKSGQALLEYCAEFCFTPSEALLRQGENIFDSLVLSDRITQIRIHKQGIRPKKINLLWDRAPGDVTYNKVKVQEHAFGKITVYEEPQLDGKDPYKNLYVAGIDSIDQGTADSATQTDVSDFCIVIKKRIHGLQEPKYVAIYKDRPRDIREAYETALKLLVWYNCKALLEHTKISIVTYFKSVKKDGLLMKRPKSSLSDIKRGNSQMVGVPATETIIKHGLELINDFINDYCYGMDDDEMLEQLLNYSYENKRKFDIVAAMAMAELADEELMSIVPRSTSSAETQWKDFGWFTDTNGIKRFGIIDD